MIYNTSVAASGTQASIVAYDNLYTGCTGTVPSTYWAYNTGGTIATSVVLSFDGTQIADLEGAELRRFRRELQFIFQDPSGSLDPRMKVRDIVGEGLDAHS